VAAGRPGDLCDGLFTTRDRAAAFSLPGMCLEVLREILRKPNTGLITFRRDGISHPGMKRCATVNPGRRPREMADIANRGSGLANSRHPPNVERQCLYAKGPGAMTPSQHKTYGQAARHLTRRGRAGRVDQG